MSTQKLIGATGGDSVGGSLTNDSQVSFNLTRLNVYETAPVESNLDIFYETGTSGLISELNQSYTRYNLHVERIKCQAV